MLNELKDILSTVMPDVDTSGVSEETTLREDLGFDSLAIMLLAMEIEDRFNFRFSEFVSFRTVGDVCKYISEHRK